jgi:hypothetical protein
MTSPLRRCAQRWRAYSAERRALRKKGVDPNKLPRKKTLGSPSGLRPQPSPVDVPFNPLLPSVMSTSAVSTYRTLPKVKQLSDKVTLEQYDGKGKDGLHGYEWIVRNQQLERLVVTMNFERCKGMELHGLPVQKSIVKAFESKLIAVVTQASRTQGYGMSYSISCTTMPPDLADVEAASSADNEIVEAARARIEAAGIPPVPVASASAKTTWSNLFAQLSATAELSFFDTAFPPTRASVWSSASSELDPHLPLAWRRLFAFLPDGAQPSFYDPVADPNDIQQGRLGDCWLCSALSAAGETPELIAALFTDDDPDAEGGRALVNGSRGSGRQVQRINNQGLYSVRLCISGRWTNVLVDDYFPCYPSAGPLFTRNHGSQIWVLLVEKAFAKVNGGYDQLISGQAQNALADLTGCPVRTWQLAAAESAHLLSNNAAGLWKQMLEEAKQDLSMCAGTVGKEHATSALNTLLKVSRHTQYSA